MGLNEPYRTILVWNYIHIYLILFIVISISSVVAFPLLSYGIYQLMLSYRGFSFTKIIVWGIMTSVVFAVYLLFGVYCFMKFPNLISTKLDKSLLERFVKRISSSKLFHQCYNCKDPSLLFFGKRYFLCFQHRDSDVCLYIWDDGTVLFFGKDRSGLAEVQEFIKHIAYGAEKSHRRRQNAIPSE